MTNTITIEYCIVIEKRMPLVGSRRQVVRRLQDQLRPRLRGLSVVAAEVGKSGYGVLILTRYMFRYDNVRLYYNII